MYDRDLRGTIMKNAGAVWVVATRSQSDAAHLLCNSAYGAPMRPGDVCLGRAKMPGDRILPGPVLHVPSERLLMVVPTNLMMFLLYIHFQLLEKDDRG